MHANDQQPDSEIALRTSCVVARAVAYVVVSRARRARSKRRPPRRALALARSPTRALARVSPRSLARRADPWNLVLFGLIGGYVGSLVQPVEQQLLADVNEMRAERNMPPLKRDGGIFSLVKVDESKP